MVIKRKLFKMLQTKMQQMFSKMHRQLIRLTKIKLKIKQRQLLKWVNLPRNNPWLKLNQRISQLMKKKLLRQWSMLQTKKLLIKVSMIWNMPLKITQRTNKISLIASEIFLREKFNQLKQKSLKKPKRKMMIKQRNFKQLLTRKLLPILRKLKHLTQNRRQKQMLKQQRWKKM